MQYLFKQKYYLQKCSHYFEEHACFSPSNTVFIGKLDGFLKKLLHMWHKYCYIVLSRVSMQSFCLAYKKCEPSFCLNKKPHKCYICEIDIAPSEEK